MMCSRLHIPLVALLLYCCATEAAPAAKKGRAARPREAAPAVEAPSAPEAPASNGPRGDVIVDISDLLAKELPAKVTLRGAGASAPIVIDAPNGKARGQYPVGKYHVDIYVYDADVPYLVDTKEIEVSEKKLASILLNLAPGSSGKKTLKDFDQDFDLALDGVEEKEKTDPKDPASVPHKQKLEFPAPVLENKNAWYRGELHAHSSYNPSSAKNAESVAELVKRAEKSRLDFLAITDRNTMAASADPAFKSSKVALIPAMEWGSDKDGVALIYGAKTMPDVARSRPEAQAVLRLVQAQGGVFAIAHPCFPTAPWQWGLQYVNAVEVWCRDWRSVPPMNLDQLNEANKVKAKNGYAYSIAKAASVANASASGQINVSANGQAEIFWDDELAHRLRAAAIAGSSASSPKVPLGSPCTWVYAKNKSWPAIVEGIQLGRTYVSSGEDGPTIQFCADVNKDGQIDIAMGGVAPLGVPTELQVIVTRAKGKKVEVLRNGLPIIAQNVVDNAFIMKFVQKPLEYSVYRVQVLGQPNGVAFGASEVLALSSPIYFEDIIVVRNDLDPAQASIRIHSEYIREFDPEMFRAPSNAKKIEPQYLN